ELLIEDPVEEIGRICRFLGLCAEEEYFKKTSSFIFKKPTNPSSEIAWKANEIDLILQGINRFPFLANYQNAAPAKAASA
ncbi:sulfotransferase domain-containing protein, partial [Synechococcus sp. AH-736-A19]|nr:sulfotransferase domain-containing protein [Synechococcus sp. AH-736-A19]